MSAILPNGPYVNAVMQASDYYSRQMILKDIGPGGQKKLAQSKVLIVGAGGLGHPVATYLAVAGVGRMTILDFDKVEVSNLNRQVCFSPRDIGQYKAEVLAAKISGQNPLIQVDFAVEKFTVQNGQERLKHCHLVVDCCDDLKTKYLIHDCAWLYQKDLVQAALYQYEGQMQVFPFARKNNKGCWRCQFQEGPNIPAVYGTCREAGIIGAIAGNLGTLQATASLKLLLGLGKDLSGQTLLFDFINMEIQKLSWKKKSDCLLCSQKSSPDILKKFYSMGKQDFELEQLNDRDYHLIDIRELYERSYQSVVDQYQVTRLPYSRVIDWKKNLSFEQNYLFFCASGARSTSLVTSLRQQNYQNCYSLAGGLKALA